MRHQRSDSGCHTPPRRREHRVSRWIPILSSLILELLVAYRVACRVHYNSVGTDPMSGQTVQERNNVWAIPIANLGHICSLEPLHTASAFFRVERLYSGAVDSAVTRRESLHLPFGVVKPKKSFQLCTLIPRLLLDEPLLS